MPKRKIITSYEGMLKHLHHFARVVTRRGYMPLDQDMAGRALLDFLNGECSHFDFTSKPDVCALCGAKFR